MTDFRKSVMQELLKHFRRDESLYLLIGDCGFAVVDDLWKEFPYRVLNCGIMEQGMVGIAAGMALAGWKPIIYAIGPILCFRAAEQIRIDLVQNWLPVKILGVGSDNYFDFLGQTHCCGIKDADLLVACDLRHIIIPTSEYEIPQKVETWILDDAPAYLRI